MSNYAGPSSHYPDDLPSDSEPGKIYDGMQDHSRVRSYGSKFDNYLASKPMRYGNGLSISDTVTNEADQYMLDEDMEPEQKMRKILDNAGLDDNFVYHGVDQHTLRNVLRTELDIINDQDFQDRDKETIVTWLSRRINQIDNEIKLEKRIRGKTTIT
tara:strand:+ start:2396 stop:2866 length:471 start_codon:yes stop_codon:yes gene_type:complete